MSASNNTNPSPLESKILRSDIVISSTSILGQASHRAMVSAISFVSSLTVMSVAVNAIQDHAYLKKLIIFLVDRSI